MSLTLQKTTQICLPVVQAERLLYQTGRYDYTIYPQETLSLKENT